MSLPLSKTLDPADFDQLVEELAVVDQHFTKDREQHPMRRWEYAMALRALNTWWAQKTINVTRVADVGGAGSPFWRMVDVDNVHVIDPAANIDLAQWLRSDGRIFPAVFCLSVLEHVDDLDRFLYHLGCLVAPGGLLFLTFDACGCVGQAWRDHHVPHEDHHFHWMRKRIFTPEMIGTLAERLTVDHHFYLLTERDYRFTEMPLYGSYTFASLALVKRA